MYRKLKRTWSHNNLNYIPNFFKVFPELSKLDDEELVDRFGELGVDFFSEEKTPVRLWVRLTLPFALLTFIIMFIGIPFVFIFTGKWGYNIGNKNYVLNWFKSLGLQ